MATQLTESGVEEHGLNRLTSGEKMVRIRKRGRRTSRGGWTALAAPHEAGRPQAASADVVGRGVGEIVCTTGRFLGA